MKVFLQNNNGVIGFVSETCYNWCIAGELLYMSPFQLQSNPSAVSLTGITSKKYTTEIIVKDLDITRQFFKELVSDCIQQCFNCDIIDDEFEVTIGFALRFNINKICDDILDLANQFNDGDIVECRGRNIFLKYYNL